METLSNLFEYDSSIPNVSSYFTKVSRNGCAAINPYYTHGNMIELPLTLPMDNAQKLMNISLNDFWEGQVQKAKAIIERGGLVVLSLHPQPYQSANNEALKAYELALKELAKIPNVWRSRCDKIVKWIKDGHDGNSSSVGTL